MSSALWTRENLAWAAGIIEGEGYIGARPLGARSAGLQIQVGMTDQDVVQRLMDVLGRGNVTGPYSRSSAPHHKSIWNYGVYGKDAYAILVALYPWFGSRRAETSLASIRTWIALPGRNVKSRKLTDDQVRAIRHAVNVQRRPIRDVAAEFGSSHHSVMKIASGAYYANVPAHASSI